MQWKSFPQPCRALLLLRWPVSALAAFALGWGLPNPHPPSRSWATTGPAHKPVLKPQQAEAQSASLLQGPVINCLPAPFPAPFPAPLLGVGVTAWAVTTGVCVETTEAWVTMVVGCWPRKERAALLLGCGLPNPHPPSRSWAMTGPAHLPVLKPQQPEAQSASLVQGPVMNCVPPAATMRGTSKGKKCQRLVIYERITEIESRTHDLTTGEQT